MQGAVWNACMVLPLLQRFQFCGNRLCFPSKVLSTVTLVVCGPYPRCHELTVYTSRPLNENGCYGDFFARTTYYCFMVDPG